MDEDERCRGKQEMLLESSVEVHKVAIQLVLLLCDRKHFVVCLVLFCSEHQAIQSLL